MASPVLGKICSAPQKVQTTQTFTHRVFQLNSSAKHVVSRRVEAFGMVDVLQFARQQSRLNLFKNIVLIGAQEMDIHARSQADHDRI